MHPGPADGAQASGPGAHPAPGGVPRDVHSIRLPVSGAEMALAAAVVLAFIALRLPLFTRPGVLRGWNSDAAIFGLMARAIVAGRDFPIFFFGQSYMGPLTSWVTVLASLCTGGVSPLALRVAAAAETLAGIAFFWAALRRLFGRRAALVVALWLAIGPGYLFSFTVAPIGAEQNFLISGAIFWFFTRARFGAARDWLIFGVLTGFGWWMNQGVVFVAAAAIAAAVLRSEWWSRVRPALDPAGRLTLRRYQFGTPARILLQAINIALVVALVAGALSDLGLAVPAFWFFHPIADPMAALLAYHLLLAITERRGAILWPAYAPGCAFILGFVIGYSPVLLATARGTVAMRYGFSAPLLHLDDIAPHVRAVSGDFWPFIGSEGAAVVGFVILTALALAFLRGGSELRQLAALRPTTDGRGASVAAMTILFCFAFYLVSARSHPGSMRYVVSALPMIYAFAVRELLALRWAGLIAAAAVTIGLLLPRVEQVRDVAEGRAEAYAGLGSSFDPAVTLAHIRSDHYSVCFANYWVAYKLEWLSGGDVAFIPWRSYDRTPEESARRRALTGRRCLVTPAGAVRPLRLDDLRGATSDAARKLLRHSGSESLASQPPPY